MAAPPVPGRSLEVLDRAECLRLLEHEPVGRIGLTSAALPVVLPVNFALDGKRVVFATEPGTKLDAARAGDVACLEVDGYDAVNHTGWSVLVTGKLREIDEPTAVAAVAALPFRPWAIRDPHHFVELSIELVSGRRIGAW